MCAYFVISIQLAMLQIRISVAETATDTSVLSSSTTGAKYDQVAY